MMRYRTSVSGLVKYPHRAVIIFVISSITLVFGMIINSDRAKIFCQFVLVVYVVTHRSDVVCVTIFT